MHFNLDVAIGSHSSQSVVIIRTRPKVYFESKIDVISNGTFMEKLKRRADEFIVRSCTRVSNLKQALISTKIFGKLSLRKT